MELSIKKINAKDIAVLESNSQLKTIQDFVDLVGNVFYYGVDQVLVSKNQLPCDFFDLKTRFAGEVLQKFSTYNQNLAIVGDFSEIKSNSLKAFIIESNLVGRIRFIKDVSQV